MSRHYRKKDNLVRKLAYRITAISIIGLCTPTLFYYPCIVTLFWYLRN
ncbi:unnamed protein product [Acanthoscelides obtectus]|uniref:Uncharacterized protein n=1 Tax=Acanthoscelides obtectus TaxID=200917 RepID=A0A9P0LQW6_ACAOB|nr:unnamed protein product [Acanthoscelides obtectus]CAK1683262.1 hypothetical protein AOBTE_LOCUS34177 [Acanthoscelides obtectus]